MSYLTVLPLATMKVYLRIDDTQSETDSEISSMIKSALRFVENHTNVMVYARAKTYAVTEGVCNVYDHPINSVTTPASANDYTATQHNLYTNYVVSESLETMTLSVGYSSANDVPTDLIDVAKCLVKLMYFEQETEKSFKDSIPSWVWETLNQNRRFVL